MLWRAAPPAGQPVAEENKELESTFWADYSDPVTAVTVQGPSSYFANKIWMIPRSPATQSWNFPGLFSELAMSRVHISRRLQSFKEHPENKTVLKAYAVTLQCTFTCPVAQQWKTIDGSEKAVGFFCLTAFWGVEWWEGRQVPENM